MAWSSPGSRVSSRLLRGQVLPHEDPYYNLVWGVGAGGKLGPQPGGYSASDTITNGGHNVCLGYKSGNALVSLDYGNVFVGRFTGSLHSIGSPGLNTCVGDAAGYNGFAPATPVTYTHCVAVGRSAGAGWTTDSYTIAIGHAPMFRGGGNTDCIAIGDVAGGDHIDGTGSVNYGAVNDTDCIYIGQLTGKSSAAGRNNCVALGKYATLPIRDNVVALGKGMAAAVTKAGWWTGDNRQTQTITGNSTIAAAAIVSGLYTPSGTPGATWNGTTDTAANIVAAGPGNGCETPVSKLWFVANTSNGAMTLVGGAGVTLGSYAGTNNVNANGGVASYLVTITNSAAGFEAVTIYRFL